MRSDEIKEGSASGNGSDILHSGQTASMHIVIIFMITETDTQTQTQRKSKIDKRCG